MSTRSNSSLIPKAKMSGRRVLVTGGAGFIGSHLVRRLIALGADVVVVDDFSAPSARQPEQGAMVHELTLPDQAFPQIVRDGRFDAIFHLAGAAYVPPSIEDPVADLRQNVLLTLHVLEAVRRAGLTIPFVYTSSAAVYGSPTELPIREETKVCPVSPYGASKLGAEQYVSLYARLFRMRTAALRLFSVFGPGQRKQVVYDFIAKLHATPNHLLVHGTGDETRDMVYVDDVVSAALCVADRAPLEGEVYNVASGERTSVRQIAEAVAAQLELQPAFEFTGEVRPGDALHWVADISRLRSLGYEPTLGLQEGVDRICAWYNSDEDAAPSVLVAQPGAR